jgi:hypothetical protein
MNGNLLFALLQRALQQSHTFFMISQHGLDAGYPLAKHNAASLQIPSGAKSKFLLSSRRLL